VLFVLLAYNTNYLCGTRGTEISGFGSAALVTTIVAMRCIGEDARLHSQAVFSEGVIVISLKKRIDFSFCPGADPEGGDWSDRHP